MSDQSRFQFISEDKKRFVQLDGLRGIAVIMVLIAHFPYVRNADLLNQFLFVAKKSGFGYIGVEIFFILSGFLITSILASNIRSNRPHIIRHFFAKRAYRLAPVILLTITACYFLLPGHDYFYQLFFMSNYYFSLNPDPHPLRHFWSLAVEEQFYMFWPFALIATQLKPGRIKILFLSIIVISVASVLIRDLMFQTEIARNLIYRSLESRMLALTLGAAMAIYGVPRIKPLILAATAGASLVVAAVAIVLAKAGAGLPLAAFKAFAYLAFSLSVFLFAFHARGIAESIFKSRWLTYVGMISFGLYVYHLPVFYYFGASHMHLPDGETVSLGMAALVSAVTVVITLASWYLVEKPVLRIKDRAKKTPERYRLPHGGCI